jgi:hypothetical protein
MTSWTFHTFDLWTTGYFHTFDLWTTGSHSYSPNFIWNPSCHSMLSMRVQ